MDFRVICRICLEANKQSSDLFSSYYLKRNTLFSEMLSSCTKLKPEPEDGLPRLICKECTKQLKRTFTFNQLCESSDKTLQNYLRNTPSVHVSTSTSKGLVKNEDVKHEDVYKNESIDINLMLEDVNDDKTVKGDIKLEPSYAEVSFWDSDNNILPSDIKVNHEEPSCTDVSFWDSDNNILPSDIKVNPEDADNEVAQSEYLVPMKKQRGRKKIVFKEESETGAKSPHQCDICGKVLSTKSNLKAHKVCHTDLRPFTCSVCPATFRGHSALFQHRKVHTGETPYHCEYCPKQFSRRSGLVNHIRMHTGEKNFSCDICFKAFVQSAQLSIHLKRHKGDKSYLCQECGKGFPIKADLRVHQRIHNGEKPYSCHLCTKTFATSGNLSLHIRIHNKDIRYNCKACQRGFVTPSSYSVHLKRHQGKRDYLCECGKTFYTSSALKQHKVVHTGEKKYQCKICDRKFTQTSHLNRHFKRDHAKPVPIPSEYKVVLPEGKSFVLIENNGINPPAPVKCEESLK